MTALSGRAAASRHRMALALIAPLVLCALTSPHALAQSAPPNRDEISDLTRQAAKIVAEDCGLAKANARFSPEGAFRRGEVYVNVIDTNGTWRVYPPNPRNVGKSVLNVMDEDGKLLVQEIIKLAVEKGEGWTTYRWLNPATNKVQIKDTFVKHVPECGLITYIGLYR